MTLEKELQAALAPCKPDPALRVAVLARLANRPRVVGRSRRNRFILIGVMVAVAAAAAPLAVQLFGSAPQASLIVDGAPMPDPVPAPAPKEEAAPLESGRLPRPVADPVQSVPSPQREPEPAPSAPAVDTAVMRTVQLLPLQNLATDEASKAAVEQVHAEVIVHLRNQTLLKFVEPAAGADLGDAIDFRLTLTGNGPLPGKRFRAVLAENVQTSTEGRAGADAVVSVELPVPDCPQSKSEPVACKNAESIAASLVEGMLKSLANRNYIPVKERASAQRDSETLPESAARAEQYELWLSRVDNGSPLASLLDEGRASGSRNMWELAQRVMRLYEEMLASPEDRIDGPALETTVEIALNALPQLNGIVIWRPRCRMAMCVVQFAEPPGTNGSGTTVYSTLLAMEGANGRHFSGVRGSHSKGASFLFLERKVPAADAPR